MTRTERALTKKEEDLLIEEMMVELRKELDILDEKTIRQVLADDARYERRAKGESHHMALNRLRISLKREPAMEVNRISINDLKLVYVICANRKIQYPSGRSPVVYIGTTRNGISRVAQSAALRSEDILGLHGVNSFQVRIVTCGVRQNVRTWHKLERALLLVFKDKYGSVPLCNTAGKNYEETNEFELFARKRVRDVLDNLEETGVAPGHVISG